MEELVVCKLFTVYSVFACELADIARYRHIRFILQFCIAILFDTRCVICIPSVL